MTDQQKMFRVLNLIKLLAEKPARTKQQLAQILETSERTVHRYLELLEEIGYHIDKDSQNRPFLFEAPRYENHNFNPEEVQLLSQLISGIDESHPLRQSISKKVYLSSTLVPLADELADKHLAKIISRLNNAISHHKKVKLIKYQSSASQTIKDREVEPIRLVKANSHLEAYEPESNSVKHFKIKRIEDVLVSEETSTYTKDSYPTDLFGFTSAQPIVVKLKLSQLAFQLLKNPTSLSMMFEAL